MVFMAGVVGGVNSVRVIRMAVISFFGDTRRGLKTKMPPVREALKQINY